MNFPPDFFKFDFRDTLRLIVWIIICAFSMGIAWNQRAVDISQVPSTDHAINGRISTLARDTAQLQNKMRIVDASLVKRELVESKMLMVLEGIRMELKYVNEKIDVMRDDARSERKRRD